LIKFPQSTGSRPDCREGIKNDEETNENFKIYSRQSNYYDEELGCEKMETE